MHQALWEAGWINLVGWEQGPRCSIRSKKMYADATPDYLKMTLLNLPATVVVRPSWRLTIKALLLSNDKSPRGYIWSNSTLCTTG